MFHKPHFLKLEMPPASAERLLVRIVVNNVTHSGEEGSEPHSGNNR